MAELDGAVGLVEGTVADLKMGLDECTYSTVE